MEPRAKMKISILLLASSVALSSGANWCRENEFPCDGTRCIPARWLCDGDPDCSDGTDEQTANCPGSASRASVRECRSTEFKCGNGNCIPATWKCDGQDDCRDNTDEAPEHCETRCEADEFLCERSKSCISNIWRCDGRNDCDDGSDELNCTITTTPLPAHMFRCESGITIPSKWVCDGEKDCLDESDEKDCEGKVSNTGNATTPRPLCRANEFQCGSYCIMQSWVCDGGDDCPNGEDEVDCEKCPASHFTCANKQCVLGHLRCNGVSDCEDESDEKECHTESQTPDVASTTCDLNTHYQCAQNVCIPRSSLCDGHNDCGDWQDESEEECGVNECERNNGGCTQTCIDTKDSYYCDCRQGYRLVGKYTCEDIDECLEVPGTCSQQCTNTIGGYHCSCLPGYLRDRSNYTRCKVSSGELYLLFSHRYDIRSLRLRDSDMTSVIRNARGAAALDFLYASNQIVWSDNKDKQIVRANITTPEVREVLVEGDRVSADGLAIDWIHNHIYYTDTGDFKIRLVSWDGRWLKTIVQEELGQPRAIVVSPHDGYVFWTDWGSDPKIERAGLDGAERTAIISAPHVYWPNGITIDFANNQLYWCDGKLNTISKANYDGSQVEVILFSPNVLRLPYSITVFEDRLYWTDWSQLALYSANKFTGEEITNISAGHLLESPKVVHVFHEYRQPRGNNVCDSHSCSHLCVRNPLGMPVCMCPDGLSLSSSDFLTCVDFDSEIWPPVINPPTRIPSSIPENGINDIPTHTETSSDTRGNSPKADEQVQKVPKTDGPSAGMIVGVVLGSTVTLIVCVVAFLGVWKMRRGEIKHFRFDSPVYRKTTDEEMDGGGLIIGPAEILYNPRDYQYTEGPEVPILDKDDEPLAPKK